MSRPHRLLSFYLLSALLAILVVCFWVLLPVLTYGFGLYRSHGVRSVARWLLDYEIRESEPNVFWPSGNATSTNLDHEKLEDLQDHLAHHGTVALLVVQHGTIIKEWYPPGRGPNRTYLTAALTKAVAGSLALLVTLDDGLVELDDRVAEFIPQWRDDPEKSKITIRQLATHSSGLEDVRFSGSAELSGWKLAYKQNRRERFALALSEAQLIHEPGQEYSYSGLGFYVLAYALTQSFQGTPQSDLRSLLRERVMEPIGIPETAWRISYGDDPYSFNGLNLVAIGSGGSFTPRSVARIGQLILQRGYWNGEQVISPETVAEVLRYGGSPLSREVGVHPPATLGWWTNVNGFWPYLPRDAIVGAGVGHQILLVVPSLDLVVVRFGRELVRPRVWGPGYWTALGEHLLMPLMECVSDPGSRDS